MNEQQNLQVVQAAYTAFKRGDIEAVLDAMTEDVEWFLPGSKEIVPFVGQRRGRAQVAEFFKTLSETQDTEQFEPREFVVQGDKVVSLGEYRWRVKSTGRSFSSEFAHVFTVQNGKVVSFHEYFDTGAANEAYRS